MQKITPFLWFDTQAEQAAKFYTELFEKSQLGGVTHYNEPSARASGRKVGDAMTVEFVLEGLKIVGLNGGPQFKFNQSLSFFVWCESEEEIGRLWSELSKDGQIAMPLDQYDWAPRYGWTSDRYGVHWQLMLPSDGRKPDCKIAPAFLFVNDLFGKGQEALHLYQGLFPNSKTVALHKSEKNNTIMHCLFELAGQTFVLMEGEGHHGFSFNPAFSLVVNCESQKEIDHYYDSLVKNGAVQPCGWLNDRFGVAWQVVPANLGEWSKHPKKFEAVMSEVMKMKKLDLPTLKTAFDRA